MAGGGAIWETMPFGNDWHFKTFKSTGTTYAPFLSYDPAEILKRLITDYHSLGGTLDYTTDTIDTTNTSVSYTFNVNTLLEGVNKCVQLAPKDWYWYVDQGTGLVHFHSKNGVPDHTFSLEKDIIDAKFEKRIEDIVNTVYFTGGDLGAGTNLFKKYTSDDSVTKYGVKALKYTDQRVTVESTADTIANSILESKSEPELRVTLTIIDNNNDQGIGYDIESVKVGDVIAVRNVTQQVGLSTWDVSRWDESYWDFNIYNLSSLQMQVQRTEYNGDTLTIEASTLPIDVNKRIEDINRNLETMQTLSNPTSPT